jgi:small-conductance mechanosensitive channel
MNDFFDDLSQIAHDLLAPAGLAQIAVLITGFGLAWLLARAARSRIPKQLEPGKWQVAAGGFNRLVFPLLALVFVWLGRALLGKVFGATLLKLAVPLIASFAGIRIAVYLLRNLIRPSPLLKASERVIAYAVWALVALYLTGLLSEVEAALSDIYFLVGRQKITLLMVLTGAFTVFVTLLIAVTLSRLAEERIMRAETVNHSMRLVIAKLVQALALFMAVLIALPLVGIDITVLSVFGGALGVGLGLGLQKVASNYVSGFIILLERSIRVGDLVTVDNRHGKVTSIKGRYSVIKSLDGTEALVPNESLITTTVINHTFTDPLTLVRIPVTVAYGSDLDQVTALLLEAAKSQPRVLEHPLPDVLVTSLGDNGIELDLVIWIRDADQGLALLRSEIYRDTWKRFTGAGIEVPFPQRVIQLKSDENVVK